MKGTELVVLSTFRSVTDAQIAKGILDAVEIESTIRSDNAGGMYPCLLYTSPSPRDGLLSRMPSSA